MLQTFLVSQLKSDIPAWCEMIRKNRTEAKDGIETFKYFCHHTYQWAKLDDIFFEMWKQMQLDFGDDFGGIYYCESVHDIACCDTNVILFFLVSILEWEELQ
jgi:hypothetical protein